MHAGMLDDQGFVVIEALLAPAECAQLEAILPEPLQARRAGTRSLLDLAWCTDLAGRVRNHPLIAPMLPADPVAVQCTFFEKSRDRNWLVPIHQDLSIPVREKIDHPALTGWSEKEGAFFVQPPDTVLQQIVIARLHLDDCGPDDGALRVVPGSHRHGRMASHDAMAERNQGKETLCTVKKGDILLMKPLLLHASSKASGQSRRRVLHFVFGPGLLPCGLAWSQAI